MEIGSLVEWKGAPLKPGENPFGTILKKREGMELDSLVFWWIDMRPSWESSRLMGEVDEVGS